MKIHNVQQGSVEWMLLRAGIPTASEFDQIVTPKWKVRNGEMVESYVARKVAERWVGGPIQGYSTFDMEQGQVLEEEARPWFELTNNTQVSRAGFCVTDDGLAGCSPDGLGNGWGLEIKCPSEYVHVKYLLAGEIPDQYQAQVQGELYVTGFQEWRFLSYRRHFPKLVVSTGPISEAQKAIAEALAGLNEKIDAAWKILCERNGGPPVRKPIQPMLAKQQEEAGEVIP